MFLKELPRIHSHGQLDFPEVWLPLAVLSSHMPGGFLARLCVFLRYQLTFPGWGVTLHTLGPRDGLAQDEHCAHVWWSRKELVTG